MPKEATTGEAQLDDSACWLCGRTSSEINSALSGDTEDEVKIAKEIAATKAARESLVSSSAKWREEVPAALKDFDLAFVLQNADQFKSMQFLGALIEVGRSTVRELDEVSFAVRKGAVIRIGGTPADESLRASIAERLNEFEKKTDRKLKREQDLHDVEYQRLGYIARLSGLKLVEGIDYLKEAGVILLRPPARGSREGEDGCEQAETDLEAEVGEVQRLPPGGLDLHRVREALEGVPAGHRRQPTLQTERVAMVWPTGRRRRGCRRWARPVSASGLTRRASRPGQVR